MKKNWKQKLHEIIYEADTKAGKAFDVALLFVILTSILIVMLESVESFNTQYANLLDVVEWTITILFTIEYILRIICIDKPLNYIFSFYGLIDFVSTLPKYLGFFISGSEALTVFRSLRLLRVFRILKLVRFIGASNNLSRAIIASRAKIGVFLFFVIIVSILLGTFMYLIEGNADSGFTSIPKSVYWTIVTMTTVGYGDIAPVTPLGQFIASIVMILGYGIIAVPTGIVNSELINQQKIQTNTQVCSHCNETQHLDSATHCHQCGTTL